MEETAEREAALNRLADLLKLWENTYPANWRWPGCIGYLDELIKLQINKLEKL